ncbi:hypothetical protein GCM10010185_03030 [Saccharothrix coeruleofusca]|uniref:Uncharacterized protein n=1 Tax=Saccharothrix coeruleofusca TaxID=33919 RepID=A0A918AG06_9PSEU|nr:hypothetical protein GCM10010185_03030 [Saccharothrix coeruleofusca]
MGHDSAKAAPEDGLRMWCSGRPYAPREWSLLTKFPGTSINFKLDGCDLRHITRPVRRVSYLILHHTENVAFLFRVRLGVQGVAMARFRAAELGKLGGSRRGGEEMGIDLSPCDLANGQCATQSGRFYHSMVRVSIMVEEFLIFTR